MCGRLWSLWPTGPRARETYLVLPAPCQKKTPEPASASATGKRGHLLYSSTHPTLLYLQIP
eukprot:scaffold265531_cov28-Tisochrysis_lutea.AAC.1